jgi:hypothetical protein
LMFMLLPISLTSTPAKFDNYCIFHQLFSKICSVVFTFHLLISYFLIDFSYTNEQYTTYNMFILGNR